MFKVQEITLRIAFDENEAPPAEWNWPIMLDLPDNELVRVVKANEPEEGRP